jgi:hypothetical protein
VSPETDIQIYQVSPDYERFDQKFHMARRIEWDRTGYSNVARQNRIERIKSGNPGYGLNDWALFQAAQSLLGITKTSSNVPNREHTSWLKTLATLPHEVEKPNVNPGKMSQYIRKIARLFGADLVGTTKIDRRWAYSRWYDEETQESYPILFSDETNQTYQTPTLLNDRRQVIPKDMESVIVMVVAMDKEG